MSGWGSQRVGWVGTADPQTERALLHRAHCKRSLCPECYNTASRVTVLKRATTNLSLPPGLTVHQAGTLLPGLGFTQERRSPVRWEEPERGSLPARAGRASQPSMEPGRAGRPGRALGLPVLGGEPPTLAPSSIRRRQA